MAAVTRDLRPRRPSWCSGLSEKAKPLNNNNNRNNSNNNNRRRGRNNNRGGSGGGGGGGIQGNRIDSRARGNAPQMLEKYRKLAHDASLNDDRVLTEYYLQFADHYFRVMADMKAQKDEQVQRGGPRERGPDEDNDFGPEDEFEARTRQYQPQHQQQPQQQRNYRSDSDSAGDQLSEGVEGEADDGSNPFTPDRRPQRDRPERSERPQRSEPREKREPREPREPRPERSEARPERSEPRAERSEPRPERSEPREPRARKPAPRRAQPVDDDDGAGPVGLDASILPPAIARADAEIEAARPDEAPVRKLRVRTKRPPASDTDEALEAVG